MDQGEANVKRRKPNEDDDGNQNDAVAVDVVAEAAPNGRQTAEILKLDIDCFEETFDYLPLGNLALVGQTCKRMQQVAGYCFSQNYSVARVFFYDELNGFEINSVEVTCFTQFIRKIQIESREDLEYLLSVQSKLRRLKQIQIRGIEIIQSDIERLKGILSKVEVLINFKLNVDEVINCCPNLRRLEVDRCSTNFDWLKNSYPKLEYFKYRPNEQNETNGIAMMMLRRNPNIRKFATDADYLWEIRELLKIASGVKLDELAVLIDDNTKIELVPLCQMLNELYEHGVYKRLQMYLDRSNQETVDQLATLNGLTKLFIFCLVTDSDVITLPAFTTLEELHVDGANGMESDIINIECIHFNEASSDELIPFIQQAPALAKIKVNLLYDGIHFDEKTNIIDLPALNQERQQLPNARKITLYVNEILYVATKWAIKETNFDLIRLKRIESFEWQHDFDFFE